jgi:putative transposase
LSTAGGPWKTAGISITRFDQFNEIPEMMAARPDVAAFGSRFVRGSISKADEAFAAFFRRLRDGEKPGYPRFKSTQRFSSVFYDEQQNWALRGLPTSARSDDPAPNDDPDKPATKTGPRRTKKPDKPPRLYVKGVGELPLTRRAITQLRRLIDRGGEPRTLTITRTPSGAWRASVGFRGVGTKPLALSTQVGGVDRGISVTAALSDGTLLTRPGFLKSARDEIAALQREREQHPRFGPEWKKLNCRMAKVYARAHNRSENWARHAAIDIVSRYGIIALERLQLVNMSKSARGTRESPGKECQPSKASIAASRMPRLGDWPTGPAPKRKRLGASFTRSTPETPVAPASPVGISRPPTGARPASPVRSAGTPTMPM